MHCLVLHFLSVVDLRLPGTYHLEEEVTMAARNCLYLPALSSIIEQAMKLPVARLFQEVMGATLALRACGKKVSESRLEQARHGQGSGHRGRQRHQDAGEDLHRQASDQTCHECPGQDMSVIIEETN